MTAIPIPVQPWAGGPNQGSGFDQSTATKQAQQFMRLGFKALLLANGWTVTRSCDSTTTANSDLWTTDAALVWGVSPFSWIVFQSPANYPSSGKTMYLMLALNSASVYIVGTLGCATTAYTGGTTTTVPAATASTFVTTSNLQYLNSSLLASTYWGLCNGTAGDWFFATNTTGTGFYRWMASLNRCINADAGVVYPICFNSVSNSATPGAIWGSGGCWANDGTVLNGQVGIFVPTNGGVALLSNIGVGGNPLSGLYPGIPAMCGNTNGTGISASYCGTLQDMYLAPYASSLPVGTETPTPAPSIYAKCGNMWIPNLGVTPNT